MKKQWVSCQISCFKVDIPDLLTLSIDKTHDVNDDEWDDVGRLISHNDSNTANV